MFDPDQYIDNLKSVAGGRKDDINVAGGGKDDKVAKKLTHNAIKYFSSIPGKDPWKECFINLNYL